MPRTAIFLSPGADLAAAVDLARRADGAGYESVWVTHGLGRDGLQVLAAYGHAAPRVALGTGVLPIYPRHPVLLAQEALTLQEVSGGRLRLGIGVSHRPMMEGALGLDMGRPLEVIREYTAVLRQAMTGRVEHAGPRYRVAWQSGVPRLPAPPPIYLAGLGTAMLELAGEVADGAVLWLCAPAYIRDHAVPAIRRGRHRAGKTLAGFEIVASVPAAVTADSVAAMTAFKGELVRYLALPFYRAMLEKSGFGPEIAAWSAAPGPASVADRLARSLGAVGDAEALRDLMAAYRSAGVTLPAIRPIGFPDALHYVPTLEAGAAF